MNPFFETYGTTLSGSPTSDNRAVKGTQYTIDYLNSTNDTRLEKIYAPIPGGGFAGINQGCSRRARNSGCAILRIRKWST
ncbi:hypothetical protein H9W95_06930 [Flavobacterium lindanitolerans]|nr:hypothetical protein [Flavobacterium lindanitolerans]